MSEISNSSAIIEKIDGRIKNSLPSGGIYD
jgi:hypothetical protein